MEDEELSAALEALRVTSAAPAPDGGSAAAAAPAAATAADGAAQPDLTHTSSVAAESGDEEAPLAGDAQAAPTAAVGTVADDSDAPLAALEEPPGAAAPPEATAPPDAAQPPAPDDVSAAHADVAAADTGAGGAGDAALPLPTDSQAAAAAAPQPAGDADAASAAALADRAVLAEMVRNIAATGVLGPDGLRSLALDGVASIPVSLWRRVQPRYRTLRAFMDAHADTFRTSATHVTLLAAGAAQAQEPAAAGDAAAARPDAAADEAAYIARVLALLRALPAAAAGAPQPRISLDTLGQMCPFPPSVTWRIGSCLKVLRAHDAELLVVLEPPDARYVQLRAPPPAAAEPPPAPQVPLAASDAAAALPLPADSQAASAPAPKPAAATGALEAAALEDRAFVAEVVSRIAAVGVLGTDGVRSLALERVAPLKSSLWSTVKPRYRTLRAFLQKHAGMFRTTATHVSLVAAGAAPPPPPPPAAPRPAPSPHAADAAAAAAPPVAAVTEGEYIARVLALLRALPAAAAGAPRPRINLVQLGQKCRLPVALKSRGCLGVLNAHGAVLEVVFEPPDTRYVQLRAPPPPPPPVASVPPPRPQPQPQVRLAACDAAAAAAFKLDVTMCVLTKGVAAALGGPRRMALALLSGECPIPAPLQPRFGSLHDFLAAHADAFAIRGAFVSLVPPPAAAAAAAALPAPAQSAPARALSTEELLDAALVAEVARAVAKMGAAGPDGLPSLSLERMPALASWAAAKARHGRLRAFLEKHPAAFRITGTHVTLLAPPGGAPQPQPPPGAAPALALAPPTAVTAEAAYIARVVALLRGTSAPAAGAPPRRINLLHLDALGAMCRLPSELQPRGCLGVLRAHGDELEVVIDPPGSENRFVQLARPSAAAAVPPSPAAVAAAAAAAEAALKLRVETYLRAKGTPGPDGRLRAPVDSVAGTCQISDAALQARFPKLRAFLAAHPDAFQVVQVHIVLVDAPRPAAAAPATPRAAAKLAPRARGPAPVLLPAATPEAEAAAEAAFLAAVVARIRAAGGAQRPNGDVALPLSQVMSAAHATRMPAALMERYGKLRRFLDAHPGLFRTTSSTVTLLAGGEGPPKAPKPPRKARARASTPPPRPLALHAPPGKKRAAAAAAEKSFMVPLPWPEGGGDTLAVRMPRAEQVGAALTWLIEDGDAGAPLVGGAPLPLLGVDVETDALGETSMVQLSTASRCVLIRWRSLAHAPGGRAGLAALCDLLADARWAKCGCELRKDALDLLHDSGAAARMANGRDVTPALLRPGPAGKRGAVLGLVEAFNDRHGTALKKDKAVQCSDWDRGALSDEQLQYAALDAWLSYRVGAADGGALLLHPSTARIDIAPAPARLPGALARAGGLLRECRVCKDAGSMPSASAFSTAKWQTDGNLRVMMAAFDTKLRSGDRVEVTLTGIALPWLALADKVHGRTAVLKADVMIRTGPDGEPLEQAVFNAAFEPGVERITKVLSSDTMSELIYRELLHLAAPTRPMRFATAHGLDDAAAAPPAPAPPLAPLRAGGPALPWSLNAPQAACVDAIAGGASLTLTLGPPGTGKTTTIAAVAWSLAERAPPSDAARAVVVLTQQNVAALNVLRALVVPGHYTDVKLIISKDYYHEWHEHEYDATLEPFMHVTGDDLPDGVPRILASEDARKINIMTFGVATSVAGDSPASREIVDRRLVGALLVDEASQAWSGLALLADAALPALRRLHLFGDDRQLPPSLSPYDKSPAAVAAAAHVRSMYDAARTGGHGAHALTVQHRMPLPLAAFLSQHVYAGALTSAPGMCASPHAVTWLGVSYGRMAPNSFVASGSGAASPAKSPARTSFGARAPPAAAAAGGLSSRNDDEVALIDKLLRQLDARPGALGAGARSCVVLTPYTAQRARLEAACSASRRNGGRWDIKTVDSFQGREADLVVVSLVRTDCAAGFMKDVRRANVLLSRAARRLYIVGSHVSWAAAKDSELWQAFAAAFPPRAGCHALRSLAQLQAALALDTDA
jgi:hypothetical protein